MKNFSIQMVVAAVCAFVLTAQAAGETEARLQQSVSVASPAQTNQVPDRQTLRGNGSANKTNSVSTSRGIVRNNQSRASNSNSELEIRTYDGSNNNLGQTHMGAAEANLARWTSVVYADGISAPLTDSRPSARHVSNALFDQPFSKPNAANASDFLWQWGQFLDHDIDLTDGIDPPESMPIEVPLGDPYFDPSASGDAEIPFNRSIYNATTGHSSGNPRLQINEITAWIDASNVYGSNEERALALRTLDGSGKLKTSGQGFLPFNTQGLPNAGGSGANLYLAGDVRANEQVGLTVMHTLFVREHNRLATVLAAQEPGLTGEQIYQQARRLLGGIVQYITYNEFLPVLLGPGALPDYQGYAPSIDAGISSVFSTAAYRFGHSALSPTLRRVQADGSVHPLGHLELRDAFFSPGHLTEPDSFESILRGLASQVCQTIDANVIDDVRNFLFGPPGAGGFDLVALNVQRGRDHGLDSYINTREQMGLDSISSFSDISSDPVVAQRLSEAYADVASVDVWAGGLAEDPRSGALVGELFFKIIRKQFRVLRDGDRFWYERDLDASAIELVESSTLAAVISRNTDIELGANANVFIVENLADSDGDSVADIRDNCLGVDNAHQTDADADGFGNACDGDLNNDGRTNFNDLVILASHYLGTDEASDLNSDGIVNAVDVAMFRGLFLQLPGPSGLHQ